MKTFFITLCFLAPLSSAWARCVVEILSDQSEPLGFVYQESDCKVAMAKCQLQLKRLNTPGATCEITLDIPGIDAR